jgi:hypothetical protein
MDVPEEVFSAEDLAIFYKTLLPVRIHHQKGPTALGKLFNSLKLKINYNNQRALFTASILSHT